MYVFYDKCILGSSIVSEAIGTIYLFIFFYKDILHKKNTQPLIKYLNRPKEHNKAHKKLSFRYDAYKHKKKQITFRLNIFIHLKKHTSNFHLDITSRSMKNKQFLSRDSWCKM